MELWSWVLCGIVSAFSILGNGGVIFIVSTRRRLHTAANWFVLSLAVADFMLGAAFLPVEKIVETFPHTFAYHSPSLVFGAASVTNLVVMTLDRYTRIVHPLRYATLVRTKRVIALISTAWLVAMVRPLLQLHKMKLFPSVSENVVKAANMVDFLLFQVMPCALLFLATTKILLIVRQQRRKLAKLEAQLQFNYPGCLSRQTRSAKFAVSAPTRESVSAKVLSTAVTVFLVTFGLRSILHFFQGHPSKAGMLNAYYVLVIINSATNPIAYAFFATDIRREMKLLYNQSRKKNSRQYIV